MRASTDGEYQRRDPEGLNMDTVRDMAGTWQGHRQGHDRDIDGDTDSILPTLRYHGDTDMTTPL